LRRYWLGGGAGNTIALLAGVLSAFGLLLFSCWLLLRFSARLPLKSLFNTSSVLMVALAVMLAGESVHSFQEVDFLPIHPFPINLHFDWLGIYPTWEVLSGQSLILAVSLLLWFLGKKAPTGQK
jgi:high-affinity iron transporter